MQRAFEGTGNKVPEDKKKVGIIGGGLGGMITAMELADAGHNVEIFESRRFIGGKVDPEIVRVIMLRWAFTYFSVAITIFLEL